MAENSNRIDPEKARRDSWNSRKNYFSGYERVKLKRFEISGNPPAAYQLQQLITFIEQTVVSNFRKRQMSQRVVV